MSGDCAWQLCERVSKISSTGHPLWLSVTPICDEFVPELSCDTNEIQALSPCCVASANMTSLRLPVPTEPSQLMETVSAKWFSTCNAARRSWLLLSSLWALHLRNEATSTWVTAPCYVLLLILSVLTACRWKHWPWAESKEKYFDGSTRNTEDQRKCGTARVNVTLRIRIPHHSQSSQRSSNTRWKTKWTARRMTATPSRQELLIPKFAWVAWQLCGLCDSLSGLHVRRLDWNVKILDSSRSRPPTIHEENTKSLGSPLWPVAGLKHSRNWIMASFRADEWPSSSVSWSRAQWMHCKKRSPLRRGSCRNSCSYTTRIYHLQGPSHTKSDLLRLSYNVIHVELGDSRTNVLFICHWLSLSTSKLWKCHTFATKPVQT